MPTRRLRSGWFASGGWGILRAMWQVLMLAAGGALGTLARYGVGELVGRPATDNPGGAFPLATLIVNVTGCFVIGLVAALSDPASGRAWLKPEWRGFLMVGVCGGYTTFSSFGLQTLELARAGAWGAVALNVVGSNILCLAAVYLGWVCGRLAPASR